MDIGTLILNPFDSKELGGLRTGLGHLHTSLAKTLVAFCLHPATVRVAYAAHPDLGARLFVHLASGHESGRDFLLHAPRVSDVPTELGLGASLSGYFSDLVGDSVTTPTVWTVLRENRSGDWCIHEGFYFTHEGTDEGEGQGPLERLCERLGIRDRQLLCSKLELPDTRFVPVSGAPSDELLGELT